MIIATAGHVDHGKTSLIKQLTGVETDRLEEEKLRGLSINLGYAYLPRQNGTPVGFIDVPGHQRFLNTMISGISGIDLGLLVVAADDGPMPQTTEHLDVLQLLGITQLVVVISKMDRVPAERLVEVEQLLEHQLAGRFQSHSKAFRVSNINGSGIDALKNHLLELSEKADERSRKGYFRLSIDRSFALKGAGLVITGTASAGTISVGDSLKLLPQNIEVRVRGIRVHDQEATEAAAGQRCAINLAGKIEKNAISRGDWLVEPNVANVCRRVDVDFQLLKNAPFSLKHLSPIKMHIGAKRVAGRIAFLNKNDGGNRLKPGENILAQLILDDSVASFVNERFLLRDHAENIILGGGTVLDPQAPSAKKSHPERIAYITSMRANAPEQALENVLKEGLLINLNAFRSAWNMREDEALHFSPDSGYEFKIDNGSWIANQAQWLAAQVKLSERLERWHRENPQESGIKASTLKSELGKTLPTPIVIAVITAGIREGKLSLKEGLISAVQFKATVSDEKQNQWHSLQELLINGGNNIPLLSELSASMGIETKALDRMMADAVKRGALHKVSDRRYALPMQLLNLAQEVNAQSDTGEPITVITLKSRFGTGRNITVEILEYFDQIRFTARQGNNRVIIDPELPARLFSR
ncbi:MAG: selenocysteine-specific translation elongation factor [Halioglobus sp.]